MRAGKLDRVITLQRLATSISEGGAVVETWSDFANGVRAEIVPPSLSTYSAAESARPYGDEETTTLDLRLRFLADITTADRLIYAGAAYNITGLTEIGRRRGLQLRCERVRS